MSTPHAIGSSHVLAVVAAAVLTACVAVPSDNAALDDAKISYQRAARYTEVARSAPIELRKAQQALQQAEAAQRAGEDADAVEHYVYLAKQRTEAALQAGKVAHAEKSVADASLQRDRILIDARTREAEAQRVLADKARMEAVAQRNQAEAARKLAEERLAATQASQAQAASAQARAKSLEDQLAQLKAKQTERGMVLTLGDVLFDTGQANLNPGASRTLDQLAAFMKENPERTIEIEGYTDSVGSDQFNQVLSERRAIAVKNALIDRQIAPNRVSARGFGKSNPVTSNDTAAGRQQNRRVEIVVSKGNI